MERRSLGKLLWDISLSLVVLSLVALAAYGNATRAFERRAVEAGVGEWRVENGRKRFYFKDLEASSVSIPMLELLEAVEGDE